MGTCPEYVETCSVKFIKGHVGSRPYRGLTDLTEQTYMTKPIRAKLAGTRVVWPSGVMQRYGVGPSTLFRWERTGVLPPRDFCLGDKTGWRPETLDAAEITGAPVASIESPRGHAPGGGMRTKASPSVKRSRARAQGAAP
jgi:hypothetical protein